MLFILFNFTMFIRGHLDAQISIARVLVAVICWFLSELGDLSFLYHLICASYGHDLYMRFEICHAIFPRVYAMYFVISVVTSTSMQTRPRNVSDFRDLVISLSLSAIILLPCKLDATERSMHILEMFSKDVL